MCIVELFFIQMQIALERIIDFYDCLNALNGVSLNSFFITFIDNEK